MFWKEVSSIETIGTNLKKSRLLNNISQFKLGEISGISRNYISEIENERYTNISIEVLCVLCRALKITPNDLIPEDKYK